MKTISLQRLSRLIALRGTGVVVQMLMQFLLARLLGPIGLGTFQIYQTWTCVLGEANAMGLPTETMKSVSKKSQAHLVSARLMRSCVQIAKLWSLCFFAGLMLLASGLLPVLSLGLFIAFGWSIFCFAITRVSAEALKALDQAEFAVFAENTIVPGLMVLVCLPLVVGLIDAPFAAQPQYLVYAAAIFLTFTGIASFLKALRLSRSKAEQSPGSIRLFSKETPYFWGTAMLAIGFLNLPFLIMPYFGSVEEIGLFSLAFKLINPITTLLIMLGAIFAPKFAQSAGNHSELKKLLRLSQFYSIGFYLPVLVVMLVFADPILALFGEAFLAAKVYLYILAFSQFVNAATGLSANLLNMVDCGDQEFKASMTCAILGLFVCVIAGYFFGLKGVAIAFSLTLACKQLWSYGLALTAINSGVNTKKTYGYFAVKTA